ncbi:MAG: adenylate cyclase [Granulosicoccus sp.]|jgi:adenylate cyclase
METIKPSAELVAIARRWLNAIQNKERETLTHSFLDSDVVRYIGTGFDEYWSGKLIRKGYADHADEIPPMRYQNMQIEAFESGNTGWANCLCELIFTDEKEVHQLRYSWIFQLKSDGWKICHVHVSLPKSNLEVIGLEHTAFEDLINSAKEAFDLVANQGTNTVMFTDIVGSSSIAEAVGDHVWAETIDWHLESLTRLIETNDGTLVKSLGDGTMSVFPSTRGAVKAAIAMQKMLDKSEREPVLKIRIGLHTGDVVQSKGDFFGTVVNKAARIAGVAEPSQILLSDVTRAMVEASGHFEFSQSKTVQLKGITGSHEISDIQWRD